MFNDLIDSVTSMIPSLVGPVMASISFTLFFLVIAIQISYALSGTEIVFLDLNNIKRLSHTVSCQGLPRGYFFVNGSILNTQIEQKLGLTAYFKNTTTNVTSNVTGVIIVSGLPLNDRLGIGVEVFCCNTCTTPNAKNWEIFIRGISSVEDIQWFNDTGVLSWSPPSFFSKDIPQGEDPVYNILVNGLSVAITTDTSVWLNISSCTVEFNVSIVTSIDKYQSTKTISIKNNNYTAELVNATYNSIGKTIDANITFKVKSSNLQVCGFIYFVRIIFGNGTARTYSTQLTPQPNTKEVIISEMVELDLGIIMIKVTFNVTEEVLTIPIDRSDAYDVTSSQAVNSNVKIYSPSFPSAALSLSSSTSGRQGSETFLTSSFFSVYVTPTGSPNNKNLVIGVVAFCVVAFVVLMCILGCGCLIYQSRYNKKRNEVSLSDDNNRAIANVSRLNSNSMVLEDFGRGPDASELSMDIQGTIDLHNDTAVSESAIQVPNPAITDSDDRSSKATDLEYPSSLPSSNHNKLCYAT